LNDPCRVPSPPPVRGGREQSGGGGVASLSQQAQSPHALSSRLWMRDAFDDHPCGGQVGPKRDDPDWYAARTDPEGLSFAVVGDPADLTPTRALPDARF
jgi:hypothetical protein